MRARRDDGQLLPLYAVILVVACGAIVLLAQLGQVGSPASAGSHRGRRSGAGRRG